MKYKKKPLEVDVLQYTGSNYQDIERFIGKPGFYGQAFTSILIPTLEGDMVASIGDYIIKGIKGEFYPCRKDIFELTYEPV